MAAREKETDPVDILIIIVGCIVGGLILMGFILSVVNVLRWRKGTPVVQNESLTEATTTHAVRLSDVDNNARMSIEKSAVITLELPEATYPRKNLLVFGNPDGSLAVGKAIGTSRGNWAVEILAAEAGAGDIVVQAASQSASDFHVSFVIR